ncbi:MAG TPA: hypothetical protein VI757_05780 [Bacteroidia bacterium]|nr:hypothetical protein [Bacteroidia bacterium]
MTSQKYFRLKKFKSVEHIYKNIKSFSAGDIFEVNTIHNTITYAKVICAYKNIFYDIEECENDGSPKTNACKCNMVLNSQMMFQIENNIWRVFKLNQQPAEVPFQLLQNEKSSRVILAFENDDITDHPILLKYAN